jgi:hypothetical protein
MKLDGGGEPALVDELVVDGGEDEPEDLAKDATDGGDKKQSPASPVPLVPKRRAAKMGVTPSKVGAPDIGLVVLPV